MTQLVAALRGLPAAGANLIQAVTIGATAAKTASEALLTGAMALQAGADQLAVAVEPVEQAGAHVTQTAETFTGVLP